MREVMSRWKEIPVPRQNIVHRTEKSVLVQMPHGSDYDGFKFWHPSKITEEDCGMYQILYTDEFAFKLFKNGKGRWTSRDIIDTCEVSGEEIAAAFHAEERADPWETHKPEILEPEKIEALEELKDN